MPAKKTPDGSTHEKKKSEKNKTQIAFGEYKKRMDNSATAGRPGTGIHPEQSVNPSLYGGVPPWPYPPPWAAMSMPPFQQNPITGRPAQLQGTGKSLFESLGNMLAMGVDLLNAGMLGGRQMLDGFTGTDCLSGDVQGQGYHHIDHCDCCEPYYHHDQYCDSCYPSCCECECCNPSVHNCC